MMMLQTTLKDKKRFQNSVNFEKAIVLSTNNKYKSDVVFKNRSVFNVNKCKLIMFLKRYFYKEYISSSRPSNQKVPFGNDMYLLECKEGLKSQVINLLAKLGMTINGVVIDKKYYNEGYLLMIKGNMDAKQMLLLVLLSLLKLFALIISISIKV